MLSTIYNIYAKIFAPTHCNYCKIFLDQNNVFCNICESKIRPIPSITMKLNKNYNITVFAVSDYKDPIKNLILAKGSSNILASKQLGSLIWDKSVISNIDFDYLVPIPLHWARYASRSFNQAEEIAKVIANKSGKQVANIVKRVKYTQFQSNFSGVKRKFNVKDAFELIDDKKYYNKNLLIVDDLMTTGSTINSVAQELIKLKPKSISAIVACRVI